MANPFLAGENRDIETAIMLEQAKVCDIGKAIAYTDGDRIFINTDNNLYSILPAYDHKMLKWLLWHERYHKELRHHNRFYKYLDNLTTKDLEDEFHVTKEEVNIIMDILVHDSLAKLFPELVETAVNNLAQMRNRNSLKYTFKTHTLEEMLDEYSKHKHGEDTPPKDDKDSKEDESKSKSEGKGKSTPKESKPKEESKTKDSKPATAESKGHEEGSEDDGGMSEERPEDKAPEIKDELEPAPEHGKTDWSKLDNIDSKEFITEDEGDKYETLIQNLKRQKIRLGRITETLNGLVTMTRDRTYAMPSTIRLTGGAVLKGSKPGRAKLYLCFDASGSMDRQMQTFKDIISKSIPQAMNTPTVWFSGCGETIKPDPKGRSDDYYKGTFKDFMPVTADNGYSDDGDRTIELCFNAEKEGYSPIGITDGGGQLAWSKDKLKQLKRTILIGQNKSWLETAKAINPRIQILWI